MSFFDLFRRKAGPTVLTSAALEALMARGSSTFSGVNVTPAKAMTYAPFFACVRVLAETVGQIPIHVFEKRGREKVEATSHAVYRLLHTDGPNAFQTPQEFVEWLVACLAMRGNSYSFITRVRDEIRELLPISPGAVAPRMLDDGATVVYDVALKSGMQTFPASSIYHVRLFTLDGVNGLSPIGFARETLGAGLASQEHGARLFANSAQPGGLLTTEKQLSKEAAKRLISDVESIVGGLENAGRTLVLGDGMKYQQIGMSSEDAQWLEGRKFTRSEIAGIMRVPSHLIADLDRATFSNIEHMSQSFIDYSLTPYFTRIEARARKQLFTDEERKTHAIKFNANALLRGDMQARSSFYTAMVQNGAMSPNEIRELEDRNPREGGDIYLTPANMVIGGKPAPGPVEPPPVVPVPEADPEDDDSPDIEEIAKAMGAEVARGIEKATKEITATMKAQPPDAGGKKLSDALVTFADRISAALARVDPPPVPKPKQMSVKFAKDTDGRIIAASIEPKE